jgi:predicted tellurium resistance membrane protein TerC
MKKTLFRQLPLILLFIGFNLCYAKTHEEIIIPKTNIMIGLEKQYRWQKPLNFNRI